MGCSSGRPSAQEPACPDHVVPKQASLLGRGEEHIEGRMSPHQEVNACASFGDSQPSPAISSKEDSSVSRSTRSGRGRTPRHIVVKRSLQDDELDRGNIRYLPGDIRTEDLVLGVKLASLAYTDDRPGTIEALAGAKQAIEMIVGSQETARRPLTELLLGLGFTVDRIFTHTGILGDLQAVDTQGFIAHSETDVALVYRGTTGVMDWLTNVRSTTVPFEPVQDEKWGRASLCNCCAGEECTPRAHRGFYDALLQSLPDIDQVLLPQLQRAAITRTPKRLIVAGHSLGGAIATGALAYILERFDFAASPHEVLFVTAGQPRFGDAHFKLWLEGKLSHLSGQGKCRSGRIVNDLDIVPTLPPRIFGMDHVCKLCLVTSNGKLLISPEVEEADDAADYEEYLEDHYPNNYLEKLTQLLGVD